MSGTTWTKFFWSDWRGEPSLRLCSYAARGLWMDMLCIAAAHDPIGYVAVAGRGLDGTDIARMTGGSEPEVSSLLGELERNGVFSRDRHGRIYSRRMISDARKASLARKNGKLGGNPRLGKRKENPASDNQPDNGGLKPHKPEARSQMIQEAIASVVSAEPKPTGSTRRRTYPEEFEAAWSAYPHFPGRSSKPDALAEWRRLPDDERAGLAIAIGRFKPAVAEVCGGKGAPCMARWLKHGKHLNFLAGTATAGTADRVAAWGPETWATAVRRFVEERDWDESVVGPRPGALGCRAPAEVLRRFGIEPAGPQAVRGAA